MVEPCQLGSDVTDIPGRFDIDVGYAIDLLVAVVRDRGFGYVDPPVWVNGDEYLSCIYAYAGEPRCIVGEVFYRAGVSVAALEVLGDEGVKDLYEANRLPLRLTLGAVVVLSHAQTTQDRGCTWGEVLLGVAVVAAGFVDLLPDMLLHRLAREVVELMVTPHSRCRPDVRLSRRRTSLPAEKSSLLLLGRVLLRAAAGSPTGSSQRKLLGDSGTSLTVSIRALTCGYQFDRADECCRVGTVVQVLQGVLSARERGGAVFAWPGELLVVTTNLEALRVEAEAVVLVTTTHP